MRAVVRLTGISEHTLRAWERRLGVVTPRRTAGGTRRYSARDVARLRRLQAAVQRGHRISTLAPLSDEDLDRLLRIDSVESSAMSELLDATERLDGREVERVLAGQLAALGPSLFAKRVAAPLLSRIGERWERGELRVVSEHLATAAIRSVLSASLRAPDSSLELPPMLFTTPSSQPHEIGTLCAAAIAASLGAHVVYLGPELPLEEIAHAARRLSAGTIVLGGTGCGVEDLREQVAELRSLLPADCELWVGGLASAQLPALARVRPLDDLESLEQQVRDALGRKRQPARSTP